MEIACDKLENTISKFTIFYKFPPIFGTAWKGTPQKFTMFGIALVFNFVYVLAISYILYVTSTNRLEMPLGVTFMQMIILLEAVSNLWYDYVFYFNWRQVNWAARELKKLCKLNTIFLD